MLIKTIFKCPKCGKMEPASLNCQFDNAGHPAYWFLECSKCRARTSLVPALADSLVMVQQAHVYMTIDKKPPDNPDDRMSKWFANKN